MDTALGKSFPFVYITAATLILLLEWTGWNPIRDPISALVLLTGLIILRRVVRDKRGRSGTVKAAPS